MSSEKGPWRRITDPPETPTKAWVTVEWRYRNGEIDRDVRPGNWTQAGLLMNGSATGRWVAWCPRYEPEPMHGEFDE